MNHDDLSLIQSSIDHCKNITNLCVKLEPQKNNPDNFYQGYILDKY